MQFDLSELAQVCRSARDLRSIAKDFEAKEWADDSRRKFRLAVHYLNHFADKLATVTFTIGTEE